MWGMDSPEVQAKQALAPDASPVNGMVPPVEHRWKPGQSGNPAGRKSYGAFVSEWMNSMAQWSLSQLEAVINDADAPAAKVAAAQRVRRAMLDDKLASEDFDRCCDRTTGKPNQTQTIRVEQRVDSAQVLAEARRLAGADQPPALPTPPDESGASE